MNKPINKLTFKCVCLVLLISSITTARLFANNEPQLPILGDHLSGVISPEKEIQIGQLLAKQIRSQLPVISDPLSNDYLQALSHRLVANSELPQKQLTTFIISDNAINAFAMPGGVIAMHSGLFLKAETEDEFSAVLAHEIAHLSQRHFARMIAQHKSSQAATLGGYLASILLLLTVGVEPGLGAMAATQAVSQQETLRFSRQNEQEADRIGMQTLLGSNMDPHAMTDFFLKLQKESQYAGNRPPEYLLTHPVTESRIADAQARATQFPRRARNDSIEYQIIRNRLRVISTRDQETLRKILKSTDQASPAAEIGKQYGMVLSYMESKRYEDAEKGLEDLLKREPNRIAFLLTKAEIQFKKNDHARTKKILEGALDLHPNNYPLSMLYAETLIRNNQIGEAIYLLQTMSLSHDDNPLVWRRLAEAHGLVGHRLGVYRAKAEYFHLYGQNTLALEQLKLALPLAADNYQLRSKIQTKIEQIEQEETEIRL